MLIARDNRFGHQIAEISVDAEMFERFETREMIDKKFGIRIACSPPTEGVPFILLASFGAFRTFETEDNLYVHQIDVP